MLVRLPIDLSDVHAEFDLDLASRY